MDDILFSRQQYTAIISRLDGLKLDLTYLKRQKESLHAMEKLRMDTTEIMEQFHISMSTLLRWRKKGLIPYEKIGGRVFYNPKKMYDFAQTLLNGKPVPSKPLNPTMEDGSAGPEG